VIFSLMPFALMAVTSLGKRTGTAMQSSIARLTGRYGTP
jgi:hypothetical protein